MKKFTVTAEYSVDAESSDEAYDIVEKSLEKRAAPGIPFQVRYATMDDTEDVIVSDDLRQFLTRMLRYSKLSGDGYLADLSDCLEEGHHSYNELTGKAVLPNCSRN